ncbi:histidine ammonia-lyase [Pseudarthrobacter sp. PS3-L1]|uniref:histidine ammonia-lyase n=1 Tax=Pseudarthrobacter sp. PS3-L1 TaxID=3046207 RepID=UPI0024B9BE9A|nr:histidine ammonia-lyase [Pseudarthrobacter sp. PS3-L1]MDJ0320648.1 histidine ammonia-lyase [Pseudarthrobacter sp. PS3-L1]
MTLIPTHAQDSTASTSGRAPTVILGSAGVTPEDTLAVARHGATVRISEEALDGVARVREHIDTLAASEVPAYGISTGFGALANRHIPAELRTQLQKSLIRSHAAGMGPAVEREVVRALMFLRAKTLASGRTGVRPVVLETMVAVLNAGITPVVREFGSLGCSGDLAPLSHCALVLMGEGEAEGPDGELCGGRGQRSVTELLSDHGIVPVTLAEKEGLALVNGTEGMLGMLLMAIADLRKLLTTADVTAALSVEALLGTDQVFVPELHAALRPHPGQAAAADNMLRVLANSAIVASHRVNDTKVQDAYSLRCAPQVAGAARDTVDHAAMVASRELAAAIDNPVVLPDGRVLSNGNFHGAPVAYVLDFLAIVVVDVSSIAERRTDRMLDPARSHGLPAFLASDPGVDSGLMIAQYTQAGLVSDNKRLAVPASVDSIPSSAMQEDHVSMGWHAARKLRKGVENLRRVLAIELVTAARAIDIRCQLSDGTLTPGPAGAAAIRALRESVEGPGADRFLSPELEMADQMVRSGEVLDAVELAVGKLA